MPDLDKIIEDAVENPILSDSADDVAKDLLQALIAEFSLIPDPTVKNQNVWSTRKEKDQEQTIHRFKDRIRSIVTRAFGQILASGNPAAQALLKDVKFSGKGITASLEIEKGCKERHALADFADRYVAVIMPEDTDQYFESMDEITATKDQRSLPLDSKASDDEKSSPAPEPTPEGPQNEENTGEAEPTSEDIELFEALTSNGVNLLLDTIMVWSSEFRETAWNWVEAFESDPATAELPGFLAEIVEEKTSAAGAANDDDQTADVDEKPLEKMTKPELVAEAMLSAASIGEASTEDGDDGISEKQFQRKTKAGLVEYIEYAREKLSNIAAEETGEETPDPAQPGMDDVNMLEAEPSVLIDELKRVLGLEIPMTDANEWSETTRREIRAYLTQISKGVLPERVPADLGPYLSAGE